MANLERYGTAEQMEEYRRQAELRRTPECKAKTHTGKLLFYQSHAKDVDHAWASSRTKEELEQVVEPLSLIHIYLAELVGRT